jgi:hypothetical protein
MSTPWVVTAGADSVPLDASRGGEVTFTVTNPGPVPDRAVFDLVPGDGAERSWFTVAEPQRPLTPGASVPYLVKVTVPGTAPAGSYTVQARVYSADTAPEESSSLSNRVALTVAAIDRKPRPWWLLVVAGLVVVVLGVVVWLIVRPDPSGDGPPSPGPGPTTIDFETPPLGGAGGQTIDPYTAAGVTFTTASPTFGDAVVGLVKNRATSACAEPADDNQKLATGRGDSVGFSAFPIRAEFATPLRPAGGTASVSVTFQTGLGATVRLQLLDAEGATVAETTALAQPAAGTCGNPGDARARVTVTAQTAAEVTAVVMSESTGGRVFVVDDVTFEVR